ncbi:MAG: N-acetylmuramoyl-L-alanine amidase [Trueperaceae bacterium]|nr:N-acetylmuramoyl-L-alanine amidase [Trueperaceae bacterium]
MSRNRRLWIVLMVVWGVALSGLGLAQRCLNYVAVDGDLLAGQPACYFIDAGDSYTAYIRADTLANATGSSLRYLGDNLLFGWRDRTVTVATTRDASAATPQRGPTGVPTGVLVGGSSYLAIDPLAAALGWRTDWDATARVVIVSTAPPVASSPPQLQRVAARYVGTPRVGVHDAFTRVVIDLPSQSDYSVAVNSGVLVVRLPGLAADAYNAVPDSPDIVSIRYAEFEGELALIVETRHTLTPEGAGYQLGFIAASTDNPRERLYVDFGSSLHNAGQAAAAPAAPLNPGWAPQRPRADTAATRTSQRVVVLDPGHGGKFSGAQGYVQEEIIVLQVAFKVKALLEAEGVSVIMTRTSNSHLSEVYGNDLSARAELATNDRNLFVSIHANAAEAASANGIETWVFGQPLDAATRQQAIRENGGGAIGRITTDEAIVFANAIQDDILAQEQLHYSRTLAEFIQPQLVSQTGARDRGIKQSAFRVLRQSRIPSVLVELGFVTNPSEGPQLGNDAYQDKLAAGIATGILSFFEQGGTLVDR